jgi:hypothetical protein
MDYKTGVTKEGKILARKIRLVLDGGAYCSWSETTLGKACILCAGPYEIENLVAGHSSSTQQDDDRRDARVRRAAGLLRLRIAHGRYREGARHRSAGDQAAQCAEGRIALPDQPDAAQRGGAETLLQSAQRFGWNNAGAKGAQA